MALSNQTGGKTWKIVAYPAQGQCADMLPPYSNLQPGPFLFDLDLDETESVDLCGTNPEQCAAMTKLMTEHVPPTSDFGSPKLS
jgi:hypothetical protein